MENESMEVIHSEEGGNGLPPDAPSEPTVPAVEPTAVADQPVVPTVPEVTLYELPDGRKVDGETLSKEWKENFLPEFTRKSQALAAIKEPITNKQPSPSPYANPEYVPQSYEEVIEAAKERALQELEAKENTRIENLRAVETEVVNQLTEIKKIDPTLDENALFLHANKYGFKDLSVAHKNMKDMADLAKTVQQNTAKNIAKRSDPVSTAGSPATGAKLNPTHFANAVDYIRALEGK